ncbi:hypothetical protein H6S82_04600 [Planktothrix sp. FACHB-1355]|uniref:Uncharacterized protein n=1 Tax=Aerosakkonema funiforme FACHB-1375 TaxID=2949571 RepID=A0A926ZLD8_9CYAN|nr:MULTISPECIES: hypothetical protein [Oscillatoriales]MBD2184986.1 hypothetical protein [Aerosakkonema funiforme FACHB-1375]MBD3558133.1 hypothetical protein [Planktothrix sp. FACHB-1355]
MINSDNIKTEQICHELDKILADLDVKNLAKQHLESCNFKLRGYWDSKNEYKDDEIGDLILVLDENLQIVDENWIIDVESPFVLAKQKTNLQHFNIE